MSRNAGESLLAELNLEITDAAGKKQYLSFTRATKKEAEYDALQFHLHHKESSRDATAKTTKTTGSTRTISVPKYIMDKLAAAKEASDNKRVVPMYSLSLYDRLKTILKKNGLPDIRFHDLRHTAASVGLMLNVSMRYMMERGG